MIRFKLSAAVIAAAFFTSTAVMPLEARAQEADGPPAPEPAFAGQTEAPAPDETSDIQVETIATGLPNPWAMAFLPDGRMLVTEKWGAMRIVTQDGVISDPIDGVPGVKVVGAEGLHDVVLDPDFEDNRRIYFTYFAPPEGEAPAVWPADHLYGLTDLSVAERRRIDIGAEQVARARLSEDGERLTDLRPLVDGVNRRIAFAPDGTLFVTGADRFRFYGTDLDGVDRELPMDARRLYSGRVARIAADGAPAEGNPFLDDPTVAPETYSYGHRDPEGAAIHPETGDLWVIEHGPMGGDEVNIVKPGGDYGWPNVSYGRQYSGEAVADGRTAAEGVEQPVYFWVPSIAPCGLMFYTGDLFPEWRGDLFVGALAGRHLVRLVLDGNRVVAEEKLLTDRGERIRHVRQGPDGALYVLTDSGSLLRLVPGEGPS